MLLEVQKDLALAEGMEDQPFFESGEDEEVLEYLYYELDPEEKIVYEYVFGKYGKPKMVKSSGKIDYDKISRSVGFSSSKVRTVVGRIRKKLKKYLEA